MIKEKHYHLTGWLLFIICSFLYMYDSFVNKNIPALAGGIAFFLGCIAFIIPLIKKM